MADLIYRQKTGELCESALLRPFGVCYSGRAAGLNNPSMQDVPDLGPIPQGLYRIGHPVSPINHLGPLAFPLTPLAGNQMHGRGGFLLHGDNARLDHTASEGCIIASHPIRETVARFAGGILAVVAGDRPAPTTLKVVLPPDFPATPATDPAT